jgi:FtsZ-binding cell division protein ZapB
MKKLIPFDIEKARNGAKVVTETGNPVTVVNFNLQVPDFTKKYILGYFTNPDMGDIECYECWPQSGKFEDGVGRPPNLMIEVEVEEKPIIGVDFLTCRLDEEREKSKSLASRLEKMTAHRDELIIENDRLKTWKESQLKVWRDVINFVYEYEHNGLNIGDSVAEWVLKRLKEVTHLYDVNNKLRDEIRAIKGQAK